MPARDSDGIVVTGIGVISPAGAGFEAFRDALRRGHLPQSEVDRSAGHHRTKQRSARYACLAPTTVHQDLVPPMRARRMSAPSRFAVAAATLALGDAGLGTETYGAARLGVSLGTAFGSSEVTVKILEQCTSLGPESISPALFTESVAGACTGQVAIEFSARGPNATITQGEASEALAIARAVEYLRTGRAEAMIAGGVGEASPVLHAVLDRMNALTVHPAPGGTGERPRPFHAGRDGFLLGEGAGILVLERESSARTRGAEVLARWTGCARAFDPSARPGHYGDRAAKIARRLRALAEPRPDLFVASASGSREGDAYERELIDAAFPSTAPKIVTPKEAIGEFSGLNTAAALHEISAGARRIISSSLASGGPVVWTRWEHPDEH